MTSHHDSALSGVRQLVWGYLVLLGAVLNSAGAQAPAQPNFGLMYNNDGDIMYYTGHTPTNTQYLNNILAALENTPIQTFMWCVGTDIMHYDSQAGSTWGWRSTPYDNLPEWTFRVHYGRQYNQQGYDPISVVASKVKSMGRYFIPSYRMNDDHFIVDPQNYPMTGQFWLNNQDKIIGTSPVAGYNYSNLLNYKHQEVRGYRMAIINESIDRYANVMDGYELDFNRVQVLFGPGEADAYKHLITQMVQQVRQKLDQVAAAQGRPQYLFVRVPPALHNNQWAGLEVEKWIRDGTVDVVIPSVLQTMSHDVPVKQFIDIARDAGTSVQIAPAIYPRTNYGWDMKPRPGAAGYSGSPNFRVASVELTRGAASNYRYLGADGMQMYNYGVEWPQTFYDAADAMGSPEPTLGKDRVFAITPAYFVDNEDTFEYRKQVPATINALNNRSVTLIVGDDIQRMIRERPDEVILRFGLTNASASNSLRVAVNGHVLHTGQMGSKFFGLSAPVTNDGPQAYFQFAVDDLLKLRQGDNTITISNLGSTGNVRITDVQLGVFGTSVPSPGASVSSVREPQSSMLRQVYQDGNGSNLTYSINDRTPNGLQEGLGGVYFLGQSSSDVLPYNRVTGFAFDQAMYYPSVEGELEAIDYSFFLGKTSGSRPTSLVSLMIMQDGLIYSLADRFSIENGDPFTTMTVFAEGLTAEDFMLERASGDGFVLDPTQHPDFSANGAPLFFGFLLSRAADPSINGNNQPYTDLDDLILTFHPGLIPEPGSALIVLALSLAGLRRRNRSSKSLAAGYEMGLVESSRPPAGTPAPGSSTEPV